MKITDSLHAIRHPFRLSFGDGRFVDRFVYSYLIVGKTICLIDAGVSDSAPVLLDHVKGLGRTPEDISMILLTHAHPDHIGGCASIKKASPVSVAVHPTERHWIEDIERQYRERPIPNLFEIVREGVPIDHELVDGETLSLEEGKTIRVIATPGHSPGSVSFYWEEEGVLFSGDAIPAGSGIPIYVDPEASLASIQKLQEIPDVKFLLQSWDEPIEGDRISQVMDEGRRYIERIDALVREIHLKEPALSARELSPLVLQRMGFNLPKVFFMVEASFKGHYDRIIEQENSTL